MNEDIEITEDQCEGEDKIYIAKSLKRTSVFYTTASSAMTAEEADVELRGSRRSAPPEYNDLDFPAADAGQALNISRPISCSSPHEGRELVNVEIALNVDTLFNLLFTGCKFFIDFHTSRKNQDLVCGDWVIDPTTGLNTRSFKVTVALAAMVGPKCSYVTDKQVMLPESRPGEFYSIDVDSNNGGIPYADSFYLAMHYCLIKTSQQKTRMIVYGQIKYKKSVFGLVKGFIEKNSWAGFEEFYDSLVKALIAESEVGKVTLRKAPRIRRSRVSIPANHINAEQTTRSPKSFTSSSKTTNYTKSTESKTSSKEIICLWAVCCMLVALVFVNVALYYKLWAVESQAALGYVNIQPLKNPPQTHDEWLRLLQRQEATHSVDIRKWQRVLGSAVHLLKQIENSISELQVTLQPSVTIDEQVDLPNPIENQQTKEL